MQIVMDVAVGGGNFPIAFTAVYVIGFLAAVIIGSIAWYNSKRPPGWEDAQRPNIIPDLKQDPEESGDA